jgi:hypothetical protein
MSANSISFPCTPLFHPTGLDWVELPTADSSNKIMIDLVAGNNKINWDPQDKQDFIDIVEKVYGNFYPASLNIISFQLVGLN